MLLEGKVVIVSGIGPGLGRSTAVLSAQEGADVVLAARTPENLAAVEEEITALGRRALSVPTDITDADQCRALAERAVAEFGRIDVLVNNAAHPGPHKPLADVDIDRFRQAFEVNVFGTLALTQAVIPALRDAGGGSIVMVNTVGMRRPSLGSGPYASSKAALNLLAQSLALELGPDGIRVNSVMPSYIWGDPVRRHFERLAEERGVEYQTVYDEAAGALPLRKLATPDEIAEAIVFFASDRSGVITGQSLNVDCGGSFH